MTYQAKLPAKPVDRFELVWWRIGKDDVYRCSATYYIDATWAEVCPDDADRRGAPFVDQWQIFHNGQFTGRNDKWQGYWLQEPWPECYESEAEARVAACDYCRDRLAKLEAEVVTVRERLAYFTALLGC